MLHAMPPAERVWQHLDTAPTPAGSWSWASRRRRALRPAECANRRADEKSCFYCGGGMTLV